MSNEQGSSVEVVSYCSKVTYSIVEDFVDNEDVLFGKYSEDVKGGGRFEKPVIALECNVFTADHCKRIKNAGDHKNIMSIADIDDTESKYGRSVVLYRCSSSVIPLKEFVEKHTMHYFLSPWNLQLLVSDFINGIRWLHSKGLYHGNIRSSTTYVMRNGDDKGTIKLGGFEAHRDANFEVLKRRDYIAMGGIFSYFKPYLRRAEYPNMFELGEMCSFLGSGRLNLTTIVDDILRCPLFLDPSDRPCYITDLVSHLRRYYDSNPSALMIDPDKFLNKRQGVNYMGKYEVKNYVISEEVDASELWDALFNVNAVPEFGHVLLRFGRILRCVISHRRKNRHDQVLKKFGQTSMEIEEHFRKYQPKLLQALNRVAVQTGFIFAKFRSHHSFDSGMLARDSRGELRYSLAAYER